MKRILLCLLFGAGLLAVQAQDQLPKCPPAGVARQDMVISPKANAPDFSTTFTDGTNANLYATLNAGNAVVLDFFFTT